MQDSIIAMRDRITSNIHELKQECEALVDLILPQLEELIECDNESLAYWYYHNKYSIAFIESRLRKIENKKAIY